MSEQRIIKAAGVKELRLPELMRDTDDDALHAMSEIDQMLAAVRRQLTELTVSLRSDVEELRRMAGDRPPTADTSASTASSGGTSPVVDRGAAASPRTARAAQQTPSGT